MRSTSVASTLRTVRGDTVRSMSDDRNRLTDQLVVRVPKGLYEALQRDAEANGRTIAQSARFHLSRAVEAQPGPTRKLTGAS